MCTASWRTMSSPARLQSTANVTVQMTQWCSNTFWTATCWWRKTVSSLLLDDSTCIAPYLWRHSVERTNGHLNEWLPLAVAVAMELMLCSSSHLVWYSLSLLLTKGFSWIHQNPTPYCTQSLVFSSVDLIKSTFLAKYFWHIVERQKFIQLEYNTLWILMVSE